MERLKPHCYPGCDKGTANALIPAKSDPSPYTSQPLILPHPWGFRPLR